MKYVKAKNDKIQQFRGIDQLYSKIKKIQNAEQYDLTFIFIKKEDLLKINKRLIPEDCFIVEIMPE